MFTAAVSTCCRARSEIASGVPRLSAVRAWAQNSDVVAERDTLWPRLPARWFVARFTAAGISVQAVTGTRPAGACFALASLCLGTSRLNNRAAFSPRILRLACSFRNGRLVIEFGRSKSQWGQSEANSNCVLALIASNAASVSLRLERSSGWVGKYISAVYLLGRRLSS